LYATDSFQDPRGMTRWPSCEDVKSKQRYACNVLPTREACNMPFCPSLLAALQRKAQLLFISPRTNNQ
jgi:hypothetical protein